MRGQTALALAALTAMGLTLAGCGSTEPTTRVRVQGGTYACTGPTGPVALLIFPDGVYELRWEGPSGQRVTGWLVDDKGDLRPTSGPLFGSLGRRSGGGLDFASTTGGEASVGRCEAKS